MIMIKKSRLHFLVVSHLFSIITLCIIGCYFIYTKDLTIIENQKIAAETLIFFSLLITTINIIVVFFTQLHTKKIYSELDKLTTYCRTHDIREGANQLRQLDNLGKKMNLIFELINETGEKRKQKLASMYQIIDYLMITSDKNILITNVIGDIQFCSHKFSAVTKIDSDLIRTHRISDLLEISINQILSDFERKKTADIALKNQNLKYDDTNKKIKELHILPIYDSDSIISNMIFLFTFA